MRRKKRESKFKPRTKLFMVLILLLGLSIVYLASAEKTSPAAALIRLKAPGPADNLERLFKWASTEPGYKDWASVLMARALEERSGGTKALEFIGTAHLDQLSAAGEEMALLRRRLSAEAGAAQTKLDPDSIRAFSNIFRRPELEPEVIFFRALLSERTNRNPEALQLFQELRTRFPNTKFSTKAKLRSVKLREQLAEDFQLIAKEVPILAQEGAVDLARVTFDRLSRSVKAGSDQSFELQFTEEKLLRKEKQPTKADELLLHIAADAPAKFASLALLKAAKNSWNENDPHRALELLDQLGSRFSEGADINEANYIEARILEEIGRLGDADKAYDRIVNSSADSLSKIRAAKRIAWINFIRGDIEPGLKSITRALDLSAGWQSTEGPNKSEMQLEYLGSLFWKAKLLEQKDENPAEANRIFSELAKLDPRGYYGIISRQRLKSQNSSFFPEGNGECPTDLSPDGLEARIKSFDHPDLKVFSQREIDFTFANLRREAAPTDIVSLIAVQSGWSGKSGLIASQVEIAEEGLKSIRLQASNSKHPCYAEFVKLAYPIPFEDLFSKHIKENKLQLSTVLSIARTESFFRPDAISPVGALGLMQVMPDTAKQEGWDGIQPLLEPNTNIAIGSKHLAKLLNNFDGDLIKAAAAYNAGSAAVNRWISRYGSYPQDLFVELIGYPETNKYVRRVFASRAVYDFLTSTPSTSVVESSNISTPSLDPG